MNFPLEQQTMAVRVIMPSSGVLSGVRLGPESQYLTARSDMQVKASPAVELTESPGAGEAVQYILERDEGLTEAAPRLAAPMDLRAEAGSIGKIGYVRLAGDAVPARETRIQRSADGSESHQTGAVARDRLPYEDASRRQWSTGRDWRGVVRATDPAGRRLPQASLRVSQMERSRVARVACLVAVLAGPGVIGSAAHSDPPWIDTADHRSLAEAIGALPPQGGAGASHAP